MYILHEKTGFAKRQFSFAKNEGVHIAGEKPPFSVYREQKLLLRLLRTYLLTGKKHGDSPGCIGFCMKEKHKRNRRFAGTLGTLGLPEDLLPGVPRITVVGREQMLLENMGGVCTYSLEEASFYTGQGVLTVRGKGLLLRELGESRVLLQGELESWSF